MLKVNYPKLAEQIDNEPLILDEEFVRKEEPRENKLEHKSMEHHSVPIDVSNDSKESK